MSDRLHILGIRHHGPGSAASVLDALNALDPARVLIEGPADGAVVLQHALAPGMRPPVAILIHAADDPSRSVFFPFAEYSPEWQALRWALARGRAASFIDLPAGIGLANPAQAAPEQAPPPGEQAPLITRDPLGTLAAAAGESDGETWWNALVEQNARSRDVFPAIAEAMTAVRAVCESEGPQPDAEREARREAHMRLAIREALQETDGVVAVICGAWHVPALLRDVPAKDDRALLKGLERCKTEATWVPWTDTRLAAASGYGAGVISPGWYRHLWAMGTAEGPDMTAARWQARVAGLLRGEGLPASTASVIEAARLAIALSAVRGFATPGLAEMRDASLAVLCQGETALLRLIENQLVIGTQIGEIDETVPRMPLALDLERWQKRLRLKPSADSEQIALDLRSETGLLKSTLLHRLLLIRVPWGEKAAAQGGRGTFRENWTLVWEPELSVKLAEALHWGSTIEQAAAGAARAVADAASGVAALAQLVEDCLLADLASAAEFATRRLQSLAVASSDVTGLMQAVSPLANVLRYGTARKVPVEELTLLVDTMTAEVCVGILHAARHLDEDATTAMHQAMRAFDRAMSILQNEHHQAIWREALKKLARDDAVAAFQRGFATRRLHDQNVLAMGEVAAILARALSPAVAAAEAAAWLEGFLADAAQLLLHDRALFDLIDAWLSGLVEDAFISLLPALRRALSNLDPMERRRLLEQAQGRAGDAVSSVPPAGDARAEDAFAAALPLLNRILGLEADAG